MSSSAYWFGIDIYSPLDVKSLLFCKQYLFCFKDGENSESKLNQLNADIAVGNL